MRSASSPEKWPDPPQRPQVDDRLAPGRIAEIGGLVVDVLKDPLHHERVGHERHGLASGHA